MVWILFSCSGLFWGTEYFGIGSGYKFHKLSKQAINIFVEVLRFLASASQATELKIIAKKTGKIMIMIKAC